MGEKPKIKTIINGPFMVKGLTELIGRNGTTIPVESQTSLCRCGKSKTKPFCDGAHVNAGFIENRVKVRDGRFKSYVGKEITINDNRRACSHPGTCYLELPTVFDMGKCPWINPDGDTVENIIATIKKCHSGALSYTINGETFDNFCDEPSIKVVRHGPYVVQGSVELIDQRQPVSKEHYCLCSCGRTKNQPFCDGTHLKREPRDKKQ